MKIDTDEKKINEILDRGVENIYPNRDFLRDRLLSGERLTIYHGVDPTGPTLHLGHIVSLRKLAQLQELGHRIIFLIGGLTATIGDPTDKMAERKSQTKEEVEENAKLYKEQASKIISFEGENPAELKNNYDWLASMSIQEIFELLSSTTYAQTIKRKMFQERIKEGKDIYVHEFMYPLLHGYDSVKMDVDGEVGGNDQTFNMLMGRDLLKKFKNKEKFVIAMKLLVDSQGNKVGKTQGEIVAFTDSPNDAFGKIMSWPDSLMELSFEILTDEPLEETKNLIENDPMSAKLKLAGLIVVTMFGKPEAESAQKHWENTFRNQREPEERKKVPASGKTFFEIFFEEGLVSSKTDFRRKAFEEESIYRIDPISGKEKAKIVNMEAKALPGVYLIGKHQFIEITSD